MKNVADWFSIPSTDLDRAVKFYETIFEITMPRMSMDGMNMAFFKPMEFEGVNGDINDSKDTKPGENGVMLFLSAEGKIDEVLGRVEGAGGTVTTPKMSIGEWGFVAHFKDTEGNHLGLHSLT